MNQTAIGGYIARKRKEQNLTQEQLAQQLGVSNKTISKWENGVSHRPMHQIRPWCLSAVDGNQICLFLKRP